jgi:hypothetical protein
MSDVEPVENQGDIGNMRPVNVANMANLGHKWNMMHG